MPAYLSSLGIYRAESGPQRESTSRVLGHTSRHTIHHTHKPTPSLPLPHPPFQAVEMRKQARKIAAAAGLIRMVKWMGLRLGRTKVDKDGGGGGGDDDDGGGGSDDDDGDGKKKKGGGQKDGGKAGGGGRAGKAAAPHYGPWIANGLLQRTHPKSLDFPTISKRLELSRKVRGVRARGERGEGA